ncbi:MAG: cobalamin biosynthesis protein [Alphaproteobacteria bacterium GM202ARS2]|nr:cobalamin biosynthesis protein [Alphaproteobacteria bacterium GM202ARS2]
MDMDKDVGLFVAAMVADGLGIYRLWGAYHPIRLLGGIIATGERWLNVVPHKREVSLLSGGALSIAVCGGAALLGYGLDSMAQEWQDKKGWGGWQLTVLVVALASMVCFRELATRVRDVAHALRDGNDGREPLRHIVGRDVQELDESGIAAATIESCFENFHDGLVAPLFWYGVGGFVGLFVYKAVSTLDSMIGYRHQRYRFFGCVAARLDDGMGFVSARLSYGVIALASLFVAVRRWGQVVARTRRFAVCHVSPNAGWPEAAAALALDIRLGGPRRYGEVFVDGAFMGEGRPTLDRHDIDKALRLYRASYGVLCGLFVIGSIAAS